MRRQTVLVSGLFIVFAVILSFFSLSQQNVSKDDSLFEKNQQNTLDEKFITQIDKNLKKMEDIENISIDDRKDLMAEIKNKIVSNLLQDISIDSVDTIKRKIDVEPIGAVFIEQNQLSSLNIGDSVELPLLGSSNYRVKITDKVINPSGSVSVTGNLVEDNKYSVVLTQSDKSAYGSITTPDGAYEIETVDGKGYIYSVGDIEEKRMDHSHSDAIGLPSE